jgi:phage/plasmid-like protein (TIGR03299 family)
MSMIKEINCETLEDALTEGKLNWNVHQESLMTQSLVDVTSRKAIVRDDTNECIGVVGNRYEPIQNSEAFGLFESIAKQYEPIYKRATSFRNGSEVVLQAELNKSFTVNGDDKTDMHLTLINSFDGKGSLRIMVTPIRLFCMNQLATAQGMSVSSHSIRHTRNYNDMMIQTQQIMNRNIPEFIQFGKRAEILAKTFIDKREVERLLVEIVPATFEMSDRQLHNIDVKREKITSLFNEGKGNNGDSLWDLYNGVTEYATHHMGSDDTRYKRNIMGDAKKLSGQAFQTLMMTV